MDAEALVIYGQTIIVEDEPENVGSWKGITTSGDLAAALDMQTTAHEWSGIEVASVHEIAMWLGIQYARHQSGRKTLWIGAQLAVYEERATTIFDPNVLSIHDDIEHELETEFYGLPDSIQPFFSPPGYYLVWSNGVRM